MKKMDSVSNVDSRSGNSSSADLNDTTQEDLESNFSDRDSETDLSELDLEDWTQEVETWNKTVSGSKCLQHFNVFPFW